MASGKTTLGRALAGAVEGLRFIDLDEAIETEAGCSVAEIFATRGEEAFRAMEADVLRRCAADGAVIACGGGTPCRRENMDFMLARGTVVRLEASAEVTVRRLTEAGRGKRPLVDEFIGNPAGLMEKVRAMMDARAVHYGRAPFSFDSDRLEDEAQIAEAVVRFSERFLNGSAQKTSQ